MEEKTIGFDNPNDFIKKIISFGIKHNVSDIHITPSENKVYIRFRIGGKLVSLYNLPKNLFTKLSNTIGITSGIDMNKQKTAQDGKILMFINQDGKDKKVNIRVSTLPSIYGENIVMRLLLSDNNYLDINNLGFSEENREILNKLVKIDSGLVLLCGGTGSGKTTTIYSLLNTFNPKETAIFTLEDPVEYQVDGYVQSEIKDDKGLDEEDSYSFSEGLIGILRQDPDVIMIGEIRRKEEASICLEAANTGHIVMGSIHSNNAVSVISRLRQFGIQSYLLAGGIKYIISQKLVKKLCKSCKKEIIIKNSDISDKFKEYIKEENVKVYKSNHTGCKSCLNGYKGSIVVSEIIQNDSNFYELLSKESSESTIKKALKESGFIPFYIDGFNKSKDGLIDIDDVFSLEY